MKPFNLERALAGDPVVTRDGRKVTQLTYFDDVAVNPLQGVLSGVVVGFTQDGICYMSGQPCPLELFMGPKKTQLWCNFYKGNPVPFVYGSYTSKEQAQIAAKKVAFGADFLQTIMIEVEE